MKRVFQQFLFFLLVLSTITPAFGQEWHQISKNYSDIYLTEFLKEQEEEFNLRFYYHNDWIDTIHISSIRSGISLEQVLGDVLAPRSLKYYVEGNEIFIFKGAPLVDNLPEFEDHSILTVVQDGVNISGEAKYIETVNISKDKVITIGKAEQQPARGRCRISGKIIEVSNGEPLIGATVYIKELSLGTISDVSGNFSLDLLPGQYTMAIDHMAMKEAEYGLKVLSDGEMTIELENELIELQEITVFDKRRGNVNGMLMGFERINTKTMKEIPVVLGEKDLLKVAQMLPGVQNVGEGSAGFNVRGGSADQNMFYINNVSIYNTSHLFGFFTAFSPDIISDFSLYKNNVPAKYGGRIASFFEINTREGNNERFFAQGGISPVTGHVSIEGPIIKEKVTVVASARSTYSDWLLERINDQDLKNSNGSFYDGTLGINAELNSKNKIKLFLYLSDDDFNLSNRNVYQYSNSGASLNYKHNFTKTFSSTLSLARSSYTFENLDKNNISEAYTQDYGIKHTEARADFLMLALDNHRIEFGINSVLYNLDRGQILPFGESSRRVPINLGEEQGLESAIYLSDEFTLLPKVNLLLGVRYSFYAYLGPSTVLRYEEGVPKSLLSVYETVSYGPGELINSFNGFEPRAALNIGLGPTSSLKGSYNRMQQYIFLLSNTIALSPTDQWKLTDYHIIPPVSDQVSVGFYQDFPDLGINISLEGYKKWISNVVEYKDGISFISGEPTEMQVLQGVQDTRGIEFMVKKNANRITGWLSYTYSRSIVLVDNDFSELQINGGKPYPSNYDRPHSLNIVSNFRVSRRLSFSANAVYTSGRPVTLPIAVYFSEGAKYMYYSDRNKYRIPDYFRIDLSANLEGNLKFKKLAHSFWMLNVYNVTGRDNAYSVFYEAVGGQIKGYKLSIFAQPIVTLSWNFKFGNYNSD